MGRLWVVGGLISAFPVASSRTRPVKVPSKLLPLLNSLRSIWMRTGSVSVFGLVRPEEGCDVALQPRTVEVADADESVSVTLGERIDDHLVFINDACS